jgi:hypothetical protein
MIFGLLRYPGKNKKGIITGQVDWQVIGPRAWRHRYFRKWQPSLRTKAISTLNSATYNNNNSIQSPPSANRQADPGCRQSCTIQPADHYPACVF